MNTNANANASANNDKAAAKAAKKAEKAAAKLAKKNEPLSFWGYVLRVTFWMLVFIAAMTIICLGLHFGLAWLAAAGLGEGLTVALQVIMAVVGHVAAFCVGWNVGDAIGNLTVRRLRSKLNEDVTGMVNDIAGGLAAAA